VVNPAPSQRINPLDPRVYRSSRFFPVETNHKIIADECRQERHKTSARAGQNGAENPTAAATIFRLLLLLLLLRSHCAVTIKLHASADESVAII